MDIDNFKEFWKSIAYAVLEQSLTVKLIKKKKAGVGLAQEKLKISRTLRSISGESLYSTKFPPHSKNNEIHEPCTTAARSNLSTYRIYLSKIIKRPSGSFCHNGNPGQTRRS
jgi:hypothetical protein